jgi:hypothetical protein
MPIRTDIKQTKVNNPSEDRLIKKSQSQSQRERERERERERKRGPKEK